MDKKPIPWTCGYVLESGEFCGKPYVKLIPGKGCFCPEHLFQLTGEKLGPLCCAYEHCDKPVTWVEALHIPEDAALRPVLFQGFCDHHIEAEADVNFDLVRDIRRLVKLNSSTSELGPPTPSHIELFKKWTLERKHRCSYYFDFANPTEGPEAVCTKPGTHEATALLDKLWGMIPNFEYTHGVLFDNLYLCDKHYAELTASK